MKIYLAMFDYIIARIIYKIIKAQTQEYNSVWFDTVIFIYPNKKKIHQKITSKIKR